MNEPEHSPLFRQKLFSAEEIVNAFYEAGLDRPADREGAAGWCESLCRHRDPAAVLRAFSATAEYRQKARVRGWNPHPLAQKFYFVHIPKTGGTAVHAFLKDSVPEAAMFPFSFIRDLFRSTETLEQYSYYSGHFQGLLEMALAQKTRKAVLLREPVARTISHFLHYQRDDTSRHHLLFEKVTLDEMVEMPRSRKIFGNYQSKYLHSITRESGPLVLPLWEEEEDFYPRNKEELFETARSVLREMEVVGLSERHEDFCRRLALSWGLQPRRFAFTENAAPNPLVKSVAPETVRKIEEWNDVDMELYRQTKRQLESADPT